jgi:hypothetical protein
MLKDDPRYKKYFVMLKVGVAMPQVKNKMELDGLDPSVIEYELHMFFFLSLLGS